MKIAVSRNLKLRRIRKKQKFRKAGEVNTKFKKFQLDFKKNICYPIISDYSTRQKGRLWQIDNNDAKEAHTVRNGAYVFTQHQQLLPILEGE